MFINRFLNIRKALLSASPRLALLSARMVLFVAEKEGKKTLYAIEPRLLFTVDELGSIEHRSVDRAAKRAERAEAARTERTDEARTEEESATTRFGSFI